MGLKETESLFHSLLKLPLYEMLRYIDFEQVNRVIEREMLKKEEKLEIKKENSATTRHTGSLGVMLRTIRK